MNTGSKPSTSWLQSRTLSLVNAVWSTQLGKITAYKGRNEVDRVKLLFRQVVKSLYDPLARTLFAEAVQGCEARNSLCEIEAVYWYVKNHVRYTGDTRSLDQMQSLRRTMELGIGDCDCSSIAVCALLSAGGHRCGVMILAEGGEEWTHVLPVVEYPVNDVTPQNRRIIALDTTVPEAYPGWLPAGHEKMKPRIFWMQVDSE